MMKLEIQIYESALPNLANHFFIMSKGYNAGKPVKKPCPNCLIISSDTIDHTNQLYWICYCLWKSGAYIPCFRGPIVPILNIKDVKAQIEMIIKKAQDRPILFDETVLRLQNLMHSERHLTMQIKLISKIKATLSRKLVAEK